MSYKTLRYETLGAVALVTLDRPDRLNAISGTLRDELRRALNAAQSDGGIRVLVVTGAGRGFCAGADLGGDDRPGAPQEMEAAQKAGDILWMGRFALELHGFDKPMIAAVNGVAAGGGMGLALAADMRVGSERARFKTVFAERALGPDCGVSYFLPRIVGYARAADLLFTSRTVEAEEAFRLGLLDRLVPHESLLEETLALATEIAEGPPLALRVAKRALQVGVDATLEGAVRSEAQGWAMCRQAPNDQAEAARAFAEKRKAVFTGE
jgi:2-(1,2-epoxy-1,2-dihydrophenyl)acetyl-CoA isomerase